jgi:hypothetical protein
LKEVAKTWVAGEGMIDKRGGFLVGSIVAKGDKMNFLFANKKCKRNPLTGPVIGLKPI